MTKLPYLNGTWFLVLLRTGGFARGIVARNNGKGVMFGYFFGPKLESKRQIQVPTDLTPDHKVYWGKFGHLGLINGEWPILGRSHDWKPDDWPMPPFVRVDKTAGIAFMSEYDQSNMKFISEKKCDPSLASSYPDDGLMGYGAIEIRLTKLLNSDRESEEKKNSPQPPSRY